VKPREDRQKVMLSARMRSGASWHDACILNMSSRGLMLQTAARTERGAYLEVRRGPHVIVARVIWTGPQRVGLKAQDMLSIDAIVAELAIADASREKLHDRRQAPRARQDPADRARQTARAMQAVTLGGLGVAAAIIAFAGIQQALGNSIGRVGAALTVSSR